MVFNNERSITPIVTFEKNKENNNLNTIVIVIINLSTTYNGNCEEAFLFYKSVFGG